MNLDSDSNVTNDKDIQLVKHKCHRKDILLINFVQMLNTSNW